MNEEILDRILIDRALGALPSDTNALLEAFLESEPRHADRLDVIKQSIALARRALPLPQRPTLPPLKIQPVTTTAAGPDLWRRVRWPIGVAAAFVLGFGLSLFTVAPDGAVQSGPAAPHRSPAASGATSMPVNSAGTDFWSASRLAALESKTAAPRLPRLTWISPIRKPQLNY